MLAATDYAKILIVDDDPLCRRVVRQHLSIKLAGTAHRYWEAENAPDALKMVNFNSFDILICDLNMPGEFGGDTLSVLAKRAQPTIKTILFTGTHEPLLEYFKSYHFDACIGKSCEHAIDKLVQACLLLLPPRPSAKTEQV